MFIDTHCHIQDMEGVEDIIERMGKNRMIVNGTDQKSNLKAIALAKRYKNVYAAIGFMPASKEDCSNFDWVEFENLLRTEKIVGIGEIGLDYYWDQTFNKEQQAIFSRMLRLADRYQKPVIVHCRESFEDIYSQFSQISTIKGIVHSFSGTLEEAQKLIELGIYLGINGMITFKNGEQLRTVLEEVGLAYIVLETDSPYLAPEPVRGTVNDPNNIKYIVSQIANTMCITNDEVLDITLGNTFSIFDI